MDVCPTLHCVAGQNPPSTKPISTTVIGLLLLAVDDLKIWIYVRRAIKNAAKYKDSDISRILRRKKHVVVS